MSPRAFPRNPGRQRLRLVMTGVFAAMFLLASMPVSAYYPFLHWRTQDGQKVAMPERFDLKALPGETIPVVVSRSGEPQLAAGDTWEALRSQVRLALARWSAVPNSTLRLVDAGDVPASMEWDSPHVELLFDELPPGVIGMAGPVSVGDARRDENGAFVPIAKSMVILNGDLRERSSHGEAFFLTLMHELGHAVGLQHTFTSSVMSTGVTRSTTKADPLAVDDHAGVATLYPSKHFAQDTGVIRGRITLEGEPLHFAGVTALLLSGGAISTLTLPDGSYELRGLPAGRYYLYAQAVPPSSQEGLGPGQIVLPRDDEGRFISPGPTFGTRFFPGVADWRSAFQVEVQPGSEVIGIDLDVPPQPVSVFRGVTTYSFPNGFAVNPAVVLANETDRFLVAFAPGLTNDGRVMQGLTVESIGARVPSDGFFPYPWAPEFLQVKIGVNPFTATGPKTLIWKRGEDVYVQPAAFLLASQRAPGVHEAVTDMPGGTEPGMEGNLNPPGEAIRVLGEELGGVSRYLLDGLETNVLLGKDAGDRNRSVLLRTPFTSDGRLVPLVALSRDGQSSLFMREEPVFAPSRIAAIGAVRAEPITLPPGGEVLVTIEADVPVFAGETIHASFGNPGVAVRRIWRPNARKVLMNVAVGQGVTPGPVSLTLWNDLAQYPAAATLQVQGTPAHVLSNGWQITNRDTGDGMLYPGAPAALEFAPQMFPGGVPPGLSLWLDETVIPLRCGPSARCDFEVPGDSTPGVKVMTLRGESLLTLPVAVELLGAPPRVLEAAVFSRALPQGLLDGILARFEVVADLQQGSSELAKLFQELRIRVSGQTVGSFQAIPSADTATAQVEGARRLRLNFEVRLPRSALQDGQFQIQLDYQGRLSPVFSVSTPVQ